MLHHPHSETNTALGLDEIRAFETKLLSGK